MNGVEVFEESEEEKGFLRLCLLINIMWLNVEWYLLLLLSILPSCENVKLGVDQLEWTAILTGERFLIASVGDFDFSFSFSFSFFLFVFNRGKINTSETCIEASKLEFGSHVASLPQTPHKRFPGEGRASASTSCVWHQRRQRGQREWEDERMRGWEDMSDKTEDLMRLRKKRLRLLHHSMI